MGAKQTLERLYRKFNPWAAAKKSHVDVIMDAMSLAEQMQGVSEIKEGTKHKETFNTATVPYAEIRFDNFNRELLRRYYENYELYEDVCKEVEKLEGKVEEYIQLGKTYSDTAKSLVETDDPEVKKRLMKFLDEIMETLQARGTDYNLLEEIKFTKYQMERRLYDDGYLITGGTFPKVRNQRPLIIDKPFLIGKGYGGPQSVQDTLFKVEDK